MYLKEHGYVIYGLCLCCLQGSANLTKAMGSVMEDLTNSTHSAYKTYTMSHGSECVLLFVCSVARSGLSLVCIHTVSRSVYIVKLIQIKICISRFHCRGFQLWLNILFGEKGVLGVYPVP